VYDNARSFASERLKRVSATEHEAATKLKELLLLLAGTVG
jgi:hypothetical protein